MSDDTSSGSAFALDDAAAVLSGETVLHPLSLRVARGEFVAIVGPNGAGKSTLLRLLAGVVRAARGRVSIFGRDAHAWGARELARRVAVVPQLGTVPFPFTVREVVAMGRHPHIPRFAFESEADEAAIDRALKLTATEPLAARLFPELSGGESQRVLLARAIAQDAPAMLLDEPTSALDLRHADAIDCILSERHAAGVTILAATHNLEAASRLAGRVILLSNGAVVADGTPTDVLVPALVEKAYGLPVDVFERDGRRFVVPRTAAVRA